MKNLHIIKVVETICTCFLIVQMSYSQQLPLFNQYVHNKFLINPANAGSDGCTSYSVTARDQWIGYFGAPRTYSISLQTRILKRAYRIRQNFFDKPVYDPKTNGRTGIGGYIFSDINGLVQRTGFQVSYSYHIWIKDYVQLSFGLALTGYHLKINADITSFEEPSEPLLTSNLLRGVFIPDIDFGFCVQHPRYDIAFSALQLLRACPWVDYEEHDNYWMDRHYYLFGSYNFQSAGKAEYEPRILFKISDQLIPQADIGFTYYLNKTFWLGTAYRTGGGIITNIGFKFVPSRIKLITIYVGYSQDFALNRIQSVTYGTHEITMAIRYGDSAKRFRWIDRY